MSKAPAVNLSAPWLRFAAGFVGAIVVMKHLTRGPTSEVIFGSHDDRENARIFEELYPGVERTTLPEFDEDLDGGKSGNAGSMLDFDSFASRFTL